MPQETYVIEKCTGFVDGEPQIERLELTEEELTREHKELLLGTVVNEFNKLPQELQYAFMTQLLRQWEKEKKEKHYGKIAEEIIEKEIQTISQDIEA